MCFQSFCDGSALKRHIVQCSPKKITLETGLISDNQPLLTESPDTNHEHSIHSDDNFSSSAYSDFSELSETSDDESEIENNNHGKKVLKGILESQTKVKIPSLPHDIDGIKHYEIKAQSRTQLLLKLKDGRNWKKDSRTTWSGYTTVRYRDCGGSFNCPNTECAFYIQYKKVNKVHFKKNG